MINPFVNEHISLTSDNDDRDIHNLGRQVCREPDE